METRDVGVGDPGRRNRRWWSGRHRVDDVGIEVAQDVVAASGELAGHGDRGQLAVVTVLHRACSRRGRGCAGARRSSPLRTAPSATSAVPAGSGSHGRGAGRRSRRRRPGRCGAPPARSGRSGDSRRARTTPPRRSTHRCRRWPRPALDTPAGDDRSAAAPASTTAPRRRWPRASSSRPAPVAGRPGSSRPRRSSNRSRVTVERIAASGTATPCWNNSAWIRWIHTRR